MIEYLGQGAVVVLVGLCWKMVVSANGKLRDKVDKTSCHNAQDRIHHRISEMDNHLSKRTDQLSDHLNQRFDDLKDFIKNGK